MRFVDEQGRILDIYQQLTSLVDEHLFQVPWGTHVGLNAEQAIEVSKTLLHRSLGGYYGAIAAQFHVDPFVQGGEYGVRAGRWLEGTLEYAASQRVPIWSAQEWLRFIKVKHDTAIEGVSWERAARRLSFQLRAEQVPDLKLTVMVPLQHGEARLDRVEVDGVSANYFERRISGASYAWTPVDAGTHHVTAMYS